MIMTASVARCLIFLALAILLYGFASLAFAGQPATEVETLPATLPKISEQVSSQAEYRIHAQDLLQVKILQAPEISGSMRVDADGNISMPLIGLVKASGMTSYELEQKIETQLAVDMIRDPQVTVFVQEFTSQRITIQGLVARPGIYDFPGRPTLMHAISMGGGLSDKADGTRIKVISRSAESVLLDQTMVVNLDLIQKEGRPDHLLKSGDIVVVPESVPVVVEGAVNRPGVFYVRGQATLLQVLTQSGGLSPIAEPNEIMVLRSSDDGKKSTVIYDYDKIRIGGAPDPVVLPGDQVVVNASPLLSALNSFKRGVSGLFSFGNPLAY